MQNMEKQMDVLDLRKALPRGYVKTLQKRLKKKYKKDYVATSISRALTPKFANQIIINEALILLSEIQAENLRIANEIKKLV